MPTGKSTKEYGTEKGIYDVNDKFKEEISSYPQLYEFYSCAVSSNSPTPYNDKKTSPD